ncbi:MAG: hypothetical protein A3C55_05875 [Gammaproteobacteria bacterium RIFCSPHIGHO2_02_FULL_42_13]|nr:MAG: hypothetical protein A3C55_05875 [Gammaproteobacteria bacterium RIFCSPHIGHO2_02_FULL_42_13]OGT70417.1 MAG: hypothetical protein A3H43_03590 [Gammaproteobacteria bacterium RIFCSPLOWO2_02_FULL_42_9]
MRNQFLDACCRCFIDLFRHTPADMNVDGVQPEQAMTRRAKISLNALEAAQAGFYGFSTVTVATFLPSLDSVEHSPEVIKLLQVLFVFQALLSAGRAGLAGITSSDAYPTRLIEMSAQTLAFLFMITAFISVTVMSLRGDDPMRHDHDIAGMAKEDLALGCMLLLNMISNIGHNVSDIRSRRADTDRLPLLNILPAVAEHRHVSRAETAYGFARTAIDIVTVAGFAMILLEDHNPDSPMRQMGTIMTMVGFAINACLTAGRIWERRQRGERLMAAFRGDSSIGTGDYGSIQGTEHSASMPHTAARRIQGGTTTHSASAAERVFALGTTPSGAASLFGDTVVVPLSAMPAARAEGFQPGTTPASFTV